ncbi:FMN-binding domain-containing protein [Proteiniborus sp. DW1]|uniref:FMN-binding protein n=1 Tax=Proteiniborus sp. DW1 TaxID=1889883 RepID=UPI00092E08E6|nr:FMN-binding protein [Proteiniborus sp. DW1]SCG83969.1 FMN-binding domain-containing protein [Proteiniborus sp. DW1]
MKRTLLILLIVVLAFGLEACTSKQNLYVPGEYIGVGEGHHGPIKVKIITDEYNILSIQVIEEYEMPEFAEIVYKDIPNRVIKSNKPDVEVVAGASYTSIGLIDAIKDGLSKALINQ